MYPSKSAYTSSQVEGYSPERLVLAMFDAALRNLGWASDALERGDLSRKGTNISKTLAIVNELQASLNKEAGGELAERLDGLYVYVSGRLVEANVENDAEKIAEVRGLLQTVRDGWAEMLEETGPPAAQGSAASAQAGKIYV
ncbi:MAG: flagellar export chaperone FliS [Myxococcota bacterium]